MKNGAKFFLNPVFGIAKEKCFIVHILFSNIQIFLNVLDIFFYIFSRAKSVEYMNFCFSLIYYYLILSLNLIHIDYKYSFQLLHFLQQVPGINSIKVLLASPSVLFHSDSLISLQHTAKEKVIHYRMTLNAYLLNKSINIIR